MENMFATDGVTKSDRILHTPGAFAKNSLLYVQEAGKLQSLVPHVCRRENLDSYLIFAVLEGRGTITFDEKETELHKGECVWIDCHQAFEHISSEEEPWQLAWVHFNGKCAKEFYGFFREKNPLPVFVPANPSDIQEKLGKILAALKENASDLEIHSMLTQLIVSCTKTIDSRDRSREIREYINRNYKEKDLMTLLTERFNLSREETEKMFEKSFGIELRDYILNRRFNAAKELLRFTIQPMDQVIEESGIRNEDLFYRLFRENESMSPEDYRKNWAQWIKD